MVDSPSRAMLAALKRWLGWSGVGTPGAGRPFDAGPPTPCTCPCHGNLAITHYAPCCAPCRVCGALYSGGLAAHERSHDAPGAA